LNADGSVGTVPDSLTKVFYTKGGRLVRDGGGVTPDVKVRPDSLPTLIYDLVSSEVIFDFATQYAAAHSSVAPAGEIELNDEEYAQFVEFVKKEGFTYNRRSDEVLDLLKDVAKREGYLEAAQAEFKALEAKFSNDLATDLMRFRKEIEPYVCDEIVHRYYHQKGFVKQQLRGDSCVEKALQILSDPEAYKKILTVEKNENNK
jgi:carboxyl-terminal processing protease